MIADPCRFVYSSHKECGLPATDHRTNTRSGPQHPWSPVRVSTPRCVQCGVAIVHGGRPWPKGYKSCDNCYWADWGTADFL